MSPNDFNGDNANVWNVNGDNGDLDDNNVNNDGGVRPYISLRPSTNVTGEGTSEKPYKVVV